MVDWNIRSMKFGGLVGVVAGVSLITPLIAQTAQISLAAQAIQSDGTVIVPVQLASSGLNLAAVQFDLTFDSSVGFLAINVDSSATTASKAVNQGNQTGGVRVVLAGMNQNDIPDGILVSLSITPASGGFSGTINVGNAVASDPAGGAVSISPGSTGGGTQTLTIANAASYQIGAIAPGELVSLFQPGLLPATAAASDLSVTFNGVVAPLLYAGANQINAVSPFELNGQSSAAVVVSYQNQPVAQATVLVAAEAPGIFSANDSGSGQALAFNQDSTANSPSNPAPRGSVISIYASGGGLFTQALPDGQILPSNVTGISVAAKYAAGVGNRDAIIQYAGPAPGLIAGTLQINLLIPSNAATGSAIPLAVFIGGVSTQSGLTIAVK